MKKKKIINESKNKIITRLMWFMLGSTVVFLLAANIIVYSVIWRVLTRG